MLVAILIIPSLTLAQSVPRSASTSIDIVEGVTESTTLCPTTKLVSFSSLSEEEICWNAGFTVVDLDQLNELRSMPLFILGIATVSCCGALTILMSVILYCVHTRLAREYEILAFYNGYVKRTASYLRAHSSIDEL
jgi:hypothetical protein